MTRERKLVADLLREFLAPEDDPIAIALRIKREHAETLRTQFRAKLNEAEEHLLELGSLQDQIDLARLAAIEARFRVKLAQVQARLRELDNLRAQLARVEGQR